MDQVTSEIQPGLCRAQGWSTSWQGSVTALLFGLSSGCCFSLSFCQHCSYTVHGLVFLSICGVFASFLPHSPSSFCAIFFPEMPSADSTRYTHTSLSGSTSQKHARLHHLEFWWTNAFPSFYLPSGYIFVLFAKRSPSTPPVTWGNPQSPPPLSSSPFRIEWGSSWVPRKWHTALHHSQEFWDTAQFWGILCKMRKEQLHDPAIRYQMPLGYLPLSSGSSACLLSIENL